MNLVTTFRPLLHLSFQVLMLVPVVAGYRQNFSALEIACDRYITSDRAEAAVASSVLQDIGVITSVDLSSVYNTLYRYKQSQTRTNQKAGRVANRPKTACFLGAFLWYPLNSARTFRRPSFQRTQLGAANH